MMKNKYFTNLRNTAILLGIIYILIFTLSFELQIASYFSNLSNLPSELPILEILLSVTTCLFFLCILPVQFNRPSDFTTWILFLSVILPFNILYNTISTNTPGQRLLMAFELNTAYLIFEIVRRFPRYKQIKVKINSEVIFKYAIPIVTIIISLWILSYVNFEIDISFNDVYTRRLAARSLLVEQSSIAYIEAILSSVLIPIITIYSIQFRRPVYLLVAVFGAISCFSVYGGKGVFLSPILFSVLYYLAIQNRKTMGVRLLLTFIAFIAVGLIEILFWDYNIISLYLTRRMFVIPSQLTIYYWEFFSDHALYMMEDSIIGPLFSSHILYADQKTRTIGLEYFGSLNYNANANIWAAAYGDFAFIGMLGVSFFAGLIISLVDKLALDGKFSFGSVCASIIGLVWAQAALHTSLLSNGVVVLIIIVYIYPASSKKGGSPRCSNLVNTYG
jgi:hypothetical protein